MLELLCEWHRRQEVTGERARDSTKEQTVQDIIGEPVELIDEDLDAVAGGNFEINFNIADIDQSIWQWVDADGSAVVNATQVAQVSQSNS
jgi:hypothetical protein